MPPTTPCFSDWFFRNRICAGKFWVAVTRPFAQIVAVSRQTAPPTQSHRGKLLLSALLVLVAGGAGWILFQAASVRLSRASRAALVAPGFQLAEQSKVFARYGGSPSCRECHEEAFAAWAKSNHGLAERVPSSAFDEPAFAPGKIFRHGTQQTSTRTNGGRFEIVAAGQNGAAQAFPVERVIANTPLRQMLVEFPGGRLQVTGCCCARVFVLERQAFSSARGYSGSDAPNTKGPASRQAGPGGGDLWGAEHRRAVCASSARPPHYEPPPGSRNLRKC